MTHTDQAFIQAYQRTVAQSAHSHAGDAPGVASAADASAAVAAEPSAASNQPAVGRRAGGRQRSLHGPHAQFEGKTPLSEAIDRRLQAAALAIKPTTPDAATHINAFAWPDAAKALSAQFADDFLNAAAHAATAGGALVLGVAGLHEGSGATTTALAMARSLAADNGPVAIIDANSHNHHLADSLGVLKTRSLASVIAAGHDLSDAVVHSTADRASLVIAGTLEESNPAGVRHALKQLRRQHPIVIIDFGAVLSRQTDWDGGPAATALGLLQPTGVVLVRKESDISGGVSAARIVVEASGGEVVGYIENLSEAA